MFSENWARIHPYLDVQESFSKGVTERGTGRTLVISGSDLHHIEAMKYQFENVFGFYIALESKKKYGDAIRWVNIGDTKDGLIGLDYNPRALPEAGIARDAFDIRFLAYILMMYGFDKKKGLFLLRPPHIEERVEGKQLRMDGLKH